MRSRKVDKTIIITGVGPTRTIYAELMKHYDVAVYDHGQASQLAMQHGNIEVKCPIAGAQQMLFDNARNDATLAAAEVVGAINNETSFSDNGSSAQHIKAKTWLPGLSLAHFVDLYANLRALDAYAKDDEGDEKTVNLVGIIVHEDVTPKYKALALWGKARGVPVIHMPHNNCYAQTRPDIHDTSVSDWILASSPYQRDWYGDRGFPKDHIKIVGFPGWDEWHELDLNKEKARTMLRIEPDETVVTLCTGWPQRTNYVDDHSMTEAMVHLTLDAARDAGFRVIWKIHPGDMQGQEQHAMRLAASYRVPAIVVRDHLPYALMAANMVISTGPSNVLVEAGIAGVAPALFNLRGYGFDRMPPFIVEPDKTSIKETVNHLVNSDEWQTKRAAFIRRYAFRDDGKAVKRAIRQIKKIFND